MTGAEWAVVAVVAAVGGIAAAIAWVACAMSGIVDDEHEHQRAHALSQVSAWATAAVEFGRRGATVDANNALTFLDAAIAYALSLGIPQYEVREAMRREPERQEVVA